MVWDLTLVQSGCAAGTALVFALAFFCTTVPAALVLPAARCGEETALVRAAVRGGRPAGLVAALRTVLRTRTRVATAAQAIGLRLELRVRGRIPGRLRL